MSEAKHTKGRWFAEPPNPEADEGERASWAWTVRTEYDASPGNPCVGHQVCEISSWGAGIEQADAHLIAAAPDLLEALKAATDALAGGLWDYGPGQDEHEKCNEVIESCRAVIAKATQ